MSALHSSPPKSSISVIDPLLSRKEAGEYLRVSPGTLDVWASTKRYNLSFVKVGSRAFYKKSTLDAWLESRTV